MIEIHEGYEMPERIDITFVSLDGKRELSSIEVSKPVEVWTVVCAVCAFESRGFKTRQKAIDYATSKMGRHNPCEEDCI